jgi:hypothetical protein
VRDQTTVDLANPSRLPEVARPIWDATGAETVTAGTLALQNCHRVARACVWGGNHVEGPMRQLCTRDLRSVHGCAA